MLGSGFKLWNSGTGQQAEAHGWSVWEYRGAAVGTLNQPLRELHLLCTVPNIPPENLRMISIVPGTHFADWKTQSLISSRVDGLGFQR